MRVAALVYRPVTDHEAEASLLWIDPFAARVLKSIPVALSPNLGIFPKQDCALVSFVEYSDDSPPRDWLDVYRLSDWSLRARLPMEDRAHFNVSPQWSTFIASPDDTLVYIYQARTLGHHWSEDFVCGLDPAGPTFTSWKFRIPECVAGWSCAAGRAHAQMLFVADGLETGSLPTVDLDQKVAFWLGPDGGMGPTVSLGARPRAHSDLGHARAIVCAPLRPLSVVVCTDGVTHLIDPSAMRYLERQQLEFASDYAMPIFAAEIDRQGSLLYVGTARSGARHQRLIQRVLVHGLDEARRQNEWAVEEPLSHMALTDDGTYLCGVSPDSGTLWVFDARTGRVEAAMPLDGAPQYIIPAD
jgi:hypothetical protein